MCSDSDSLLLIGVCTIVTQCTLNFHIKFIFIFICFLSQQSIFITICMGMVLVMNVYAIVKELVQISQQVGLQKFHEVL